MKCRRLFLSLLLTSLSASLPAQWIRQSSGVTTTLTDVATLDSVTAVVVGDDGSILRTTDAGLTWNNVAAPYSWVTKWLAVDFFDTMIGAVVGEHGTCALTTDGGMQWTYAAIPGDRSCLCVLSTPTLNIVGDDSGYVHFLNDSGEVWRSQRISDWPIRSIFVWRGAYLDQNWMRAVTPHSLCSAYGLHPDWWLEDTMEVFQGVGSEAFRGEYTGGGGPGYVVGVQGDTRAVPLIVRGSIPDSSWHPVSVGTTRDGALRDVSAPSHHAVYVCGTNGLLLKSTNGGEKWIEQTIPTTVALNAVSFFRDKIGFAVGDSGVILHTSNGGITQVDVESPIAPNGFALLQSYPNPLNPFNPGTHIGFVLPVRAFVTLVIYDALGREIAVLASRTFEPGRHTLTWYAGSCSSVVYFCRISAGRFTAVQKLVYMK